MPKTKYITEIKEAFPDLQFKRSRIIRSGWDNDVVILDNALVFRFPKNTECLKRFRSELCLLKYLKGRTKIPIPDYTFIPANKRFGGYKMIQGSKLKKSIFKKLSKQKIRKIAKQLGEFFSVMHNIPSSVVEKCGYTPERGGYCWSKAHAARTIKKARKIVFPKLTKREIEWTEVQFGLYLSLNFNIKAKLIHDDFVDDHILVDPEKGVVTGIIDFADAGIADPAMDFSGLWIYGDAFVNEVLNHYKHPIDSHFLERLKLRNKLRPIGHFVEYLEGKRIPLSLVDIKKELRATMNQ